MKFQGFGTAALLLFSVGCDVSHIDKVTINPATDAGAKDASAVGTSNFISIGAGTLSDDAVVPGGAVLSGVFTFQNQSAKKNSITLLCVMVNGSVPDIGSVDFDVITSNRNVSFYSVSLDNSTAKNGTWACPTIDMSFEPESYTTIMVTLNTKPSAVVGSTYTVAIVPGNYGYAMESAPVHGSFPLSSGTVTVIPP